LIDALQGLGVAVVVSIVASTGADAAGAASSSPPTGAGWDVSVPRDCCQNRWANDTGSIPAAFHQARSSPTRCTAR
jgi:hypothetical protein